MQVLKTFSHHSSFLKSLGSLAYKELLSIFDEFFHQKTYPQVFATTKNHQVTLLLFKQSG